MAGTSSIRHMMCHSDPRCFDITLLALWAPAKRFVPRSHVRWWHLADVDLEAEHVCSAALSDIDLLGYGERIINLNSEIADRALDLGVAQQELNRSKISLFSYRSVLPSFCGVNACHRSMDQGRSLRATLPAVLRTAAWSDALPHRVQGRGMD